MNKYIFIILIANIILSCSITKETKSSNTVSRDEQKLAKQATITEAVESKSYAVELDRLYLSWYGVVYLPPQRNYIIIDGEKARIIAGYMGRQYGLRPIAGINLTGEPMNYELTKDLSKGRFKIKMDVTKGGDTFHVYLTISENGYCSASISGAKIDNARYSGNLIPIEKKRSAQTSDGIII